MFDPKVILKCTQSNPNDPAKILKWPHSCTQPTCPPTHAPTHRPNCIHYQCLIVCGFELHTYFLVLVFLYVQVLTCALFGCSQMHMLGIKGWIEKLVLQHNLQTLKDDATLTTNANAPCVFQKLKVHKLCSHEIDFANGHLDIYNRLIGVS